MTISVPASMGISGEGTKTSVFPALTLAVGCLLPQQLFEPFSFTPNPHAVNLQLPMFLLQLFHIFRQRDLTKLSSVIRSPEATATSQDYQSLCGYRRIVESCYNLRAGIFFFPL